MKEVGTLKELDVKPGDVVELQECGTHYTIGENPYKERGEVKTASGFLYDWRLAKIIYRANTPKLWRDMTDAEKGALLLAFHNDKKCLEIWRNGKWVDCGDSTWNNNIAYRIRPEPKVEVVTMDGADIRFSGFIKDHRITFTTIDGKPDCVSIKMEAI